MAKTSDKFGASCEAIVVEDKIPFGLAIGKRGSPCRQVVIEGNSRGRRDTARPPTATAR